MPLPSLASWQNQLSSASWRGIPFAATVTSVSGGERNAIHEYFGRDLPYVESTGSAPQLISLTGFLWGNVAYAQRDALGVACLKHGPGTLVHPSIGEMEVNLQNWSFEERVEDGGYVAVNLSFIKSDAQVFVATFLTDILTSIDGIFAAVGGALAMVKRFASQALAIALFTVNSVVALINSVIGFATSLIGLVKDPAQILGAVSGIQSIMGLSGSPTANSLLSRYNPGNVSDINPVLTGINPSQAPSLVVDQATTALLTNLTVQRAALDAAQSALIGLATTDPTKGLLDGIQGFTETFRGVVNDPADQIRLLATLMSYTGQNYIGSSNYALAQQQINTIMVSQFHYATLLSIANAIAEYQPTSFNDARDILTLVVPLFDQAILDAANQFDTDSFTALSSLKAAVIDDLTTRGQSLSSLVTLIESTNLPSVVVAWRQYQNAGRDVDVLQRVNPHHPGFMPLSFEILAS